MERTMLTTFTADELEQFIANAVEKAIQQGAEKSLRGTASETRKILTLSEFCAHTGLSKQTAYKLTSTQSVPHSKRGKKLYFDREEIDAWLLENRVPTATEIQKKARDYMTANPIRKRA